MALMAVLESDLRALSAEARRRYSSVKDGAEHAILKLRSLSGPGEIAHNEDILRIFLIACEVKAVKLSVIGLSCLQKLISHDAVAPSALKEILATLKDHAEMADETVQLKTLQTILIIFQSRLHPEDEDDMARALGICLHLLENSRSDSVRNTAAATFRQAVALIFDHVICEESLSLGKFDTGGHVSPTTLVTSDANRHFNCSELLEHEFVSGAPPQMRGRLTKAGELGLRLLEDLTALAAGGCAFWLCVSSIQRTFALDILEFILSNYVAVFRTLVSYKQVLRHQICSLLMTSIRTNAEIEGETGDPYYRRLLLRSVAHIIRLYNSSLLTECEVFLSMLINVTSLDLPLWHRILVLEILRGFCMEARTLQTLFQNFDMNPKNTNVVEGMVKALARVVLSIQVQDTTEESMAAVAGMFSSKAKGIEWSLDNDASNTTVLVASEAHTITLAIEGLLGVVFTVATLTDEAVDVGELDSPRCNCDPPEKVTGNIALTCISMVDSMWFTILDALSLILTRSQGEALILEILKGYQAFTQACGVLRVVEPLNSFLASLCKFTINVPSEAEKKSALQSPGSKRSELVADQRDTVVLTPKNVQALRTLFNIAHRLSNVLGPSWILVLETLAALDRALRSPHATTQDVATTAPKLTRESSLKYSDFHILSSLNTQLFESSGLMHISAVKSLLSALRQLSYQSISVTSATFGQGSAQQIGTISFSVERMISILVNNLHRVKPLWDQVVGHFLELADNCNQKLRCMSLDALDQSICAVLGSDQLETRAPCDPDDTSCYSKSMVEELRSLEYAVLSPLRALYFSKTSIDVHIGILKILLHVLERHGEKLKYSLPDILQILRSVANASEKDLITLGFQCLRVIMNEGLSMVPPDCLNVCIDVIGAYSAQKNELNISLTAIGLLWTTADFIAKGHLQGPSEGKEIGRLDMHSSPTLIRKEKNDEEILNISTKQSTLVKAVDRDKLLFSIFTLLHKLGVDERPEVRNAAVRTLFQTLGSNGEKLSRGLWEDCLWNYVFPILDCASHMAATSSKDEWQGKELGTRRGKAVHMLIHHSRNTAQKQWDETLVLVLSGIARLFRSFFPFLRGLESFWSGWESLLLIVKTSILNGNKEVAIAGINCLQTTVLSHSSKGNVPMLHLESIIDVYESVSRSSPNFSSSAAIKVKQEMLLGLGELYVQAQGMFDTGMYARLLAIIRSEVEQAKITGDGFEAEFGHLPPVQRTILDIIPMLCPSEKYSSMWYILLRELLQYLPSSDPPIHNKEVMEEKCSTKHYIPDSHKRETSGTSNGAVSAASKRKDVTSMSSTSNISTVTGISSYLFAEKLVPMTIDLALRAPAVEKSNIYPEIIESLGRCMMTRRDNPDDTLWRLAAEGFNKILIDDVNRFSMNFVPDASNSGASRGRFWKVVADVYEIFLVGYCGRALFSNSLSSTALEADESLEMSILGVLGDKILKSQIGAPAEILHRLVTTLDRCASRTCSLPVETVELMPVHCSRFSLTCLQKLFSVCGYSKEEDNWNLTRSEVSKISIMVLLTRCEFIFNRFLTDESDLGERPFPTARLEEIIYVLEELSRLTLHADTASILPVHSSMKKGLMDAHHDRHLHLFALYPSFCELVISREARVRELVQVLLRLIGTELGLQKASGNN